jgi:hypothetical protein
MKKSMILGALALSALMSGVSASAHHNANAEWQTDKELPMTGKLVMVRDIMPHAQWVFEVKGEQWKFEAISANALRRQGVLVKTAIKPGQTYNFFYSPSRTAGKKTGFLTALVLNGKKVTFVRL